MSNSVHWSVSVDTVTDALVRMELAHQGATATLDSFVVEAVRRELDRLALLAREARTLPDADDDDMWTIKIPRPA